MYTIDITKWARKNSKKIDSIHMKKIKLQVNMLINEPQKGKRLKGEFSNYYRLRVQQYRVIYEIDDINSIIFIVDMGHRKDIYKRLASR